ncbi:MAG: hypothetical protein ACYDCK_11895 [Thermoplasmatota archaeon]
MSATGESERTIRQADEAREIKVRIPLDYHIKLHTLKVLKGQSISDTVEIALRNYFQVYSDQNPDEYSRFHVQGVTTFHA